MASAFDFPNDDFPADDFEQADEPWFVEPKDKDPAPEFDRQRAFVTFMRKHAPSVLVFAVPNGQKGSDWQRMRKWKEGTVAGMTDLVILWRGDQFFAEFKDGTGAPSPQQRDVLNHLSRLGYGCGVYRTAATLIAHLREAGAPFLDQGR